ncbi:hypothetical protein [Sulfitobacter sp.]|jgi:hypothetical protein|uniref:hypothetical protein n=1 Tax=Sulfitobacter sp. TaxID=1903071 RepID=UPI003036FF75
MSDSNDPKSAEINDLINKNLKQVFADLEDDGMPGQIIDLLSVLRAQDMEKKEEK